MRKIPYNSQRDNYDFGGTFKAWWQCFSTCSWMFMSYYTNRISSPDDKGLAAYLDDVEATVGKPGIAEACMRKYKWITGRTSLWWKIQEEGINKYLNDYGVGGSCAFFDGNFPIYSLSSVLRNGPVILATRGIGGLPGGHIILLVDHDEKEGSFIVNDPFGNAMMSYRDIDGSAVQYNYDWLKRYIVVQKERCRCMFWNKK